VGEIPRNCEATAERFAMEIGSPFVSLLEPYQKLAESGEYVAESGCFRGAKEVNLSTFSQSELD
jgi:hypothetical protein